MKKTNKKTSAIAVKAKSKASKPKPDIKPNVAAEIKAARKGSKQSILISILRSPKGATVAELAETTGWQNHSVQGAIFGALKKKLGLNIVSEKEQRGRVYRIA